MRDIDLKNKVTDAWNIVVPLNASCRLDNVSLGGLRTGREERDKSQHSESLQRTPRK